MPVTYRAAARVNQIFCAESLQKMN